MWVGTENVILQNKKAIKQKMVMLVQTVGCKPVFLCGKIYK